MPQTFKRWLHLGSILKGIFGVYLRGDSFLCILILMKKSTQLQNMTDSDTLTKSKEGPVAHFKIIQNSA